MLWAVHTLGYDAYFRASKSPLEITYLPTGQKVAFVGLDDPRKTKGTVFPVGYGAIQWFEECDELAGWESVQQVLRTFRRGGGLVLDVLHLQPAEDAVVMGQPPGGGDAPQAVLHEPAHDLPRCAGIPPRLAWRAVRGGCGVPARRAPRSPTAGSSLGEATGTGGSVFGNVREVRLTDADIDGFDNVRNGVDWGWFPDPWRFVQCEWQPGLRRLVVWNELTANRTTPRDTGAMVHRELRDKSEPVFCDSADPTSIGVYRRECGVNARAAKKGGMRRASYEWLAGLREIAIDPVRCPHAWEEFRLCEFAKDRNGDWVDEYPDGNDHSIDAVRYAVMRDVARGR
ncbi:MAG: PBSX family phage terminase large subunit [Eggerthellaceae bacterium]